MWPGGGNTASNIGGGIVSITTTTLTNSTVSGNEAGGVGGGIYGPGKLTNSTVRRNTSGKRGGGIYADTGSFSVTRSNQGLNHSSHGVESRFRYSLRKTS